MKASLLLGAGMGIFSPSAYVRISKDTFRLMEHDLLTGTTQTLRTFPDSPLGGIILAVGSEFEGHYPSGTPAGVLKKASQKEQIEHLRALRSDYNRFYRQHLVAGMPDGEARLAANRDMQDVGYFPKYPTLSARLVEPGEVNSELSVFKISRTEMESGIFNDIAGAIAAPETAVKQNGYSYITYSGYDTSKRLNTHLKTGALKYRVEYQGKFYELTIEKP